MELTTRGLWTMIHGMGFGGLFLMACSGALVEFSRLTAPGTLVPAEIGRPTFLRIYLIVMVVLAWFAVLSGAYVIYPWYRAVAPAGTMDLSGFPQLLLRASPSTSQWHSFGMEWKEHVAWLAPISITTVAVVFLQYGRDLRHHRQLRTAVLAFACVAFLAAGVAAFFGATINKVAPTQGGGVIHLLRGE